MRCSNGVMEWEVLNSLLWCHRPILDVSARVIEVEIELEAASACARAEREVFGKDEAAVLPATTHRPGSATLLSVIHHRFEDAAVDQGASKAGRMDRDEAFFLLPWELVPTGLVVTAVLVEEVAVGEDAASLTVEGYGGEDELDTCSFGSVDDLECGEFRDRVLVDHEEPGRGASLEEAIDEGLAHVFDVAFRHVVEGRDGGSWGIEAELVEFPAFEGEDDVAGGGDDDGDAVRGERRGGGFPV